MGKNDNLIEDYRTVIADRLLSSPVIVDLLSRGTLVPENSRSLLWKNIIPQQYLPVTDENTDSYIFFDIDEEIIRNEKTCIELIVYFWAVSHKNNSVYKSKLKNDVLVREIKKLFQDDCELGISKNKCIYNRILNTGSNVHTGRCIAFKVIDWSDKIRYGR